jgi:hypothetical protein
MGRLSENSVVSIKMNSTVPTNCTSAAHQSMRCGSQLRSRHRSGTSTPGGTRDAFATSRYSRQAAAVKSSDPTKKVTPSVATPTALTKRGAAPSAKHSDPPANRTPIHHPTAPGAHHVDPCPVSSSECRFRC